MKKILITGANGFLGQHLCKYLSEKGYMVVATGRGERRLPMHIKVAYIEADITNKDQVETLLQVVKPGVLIHNAAMSKPDECNKEREKCVQANVEATRFLLQYPVEHFIYMSTDFVFGENGPHAEDAPKGPLNFYGESKLAAEELVQASGQQVTIVRPVFIYGQAWDGIRGSFVQWVKQNLEQGKRIKVVSDQQRTPTYAEDICKGIDAIITRKALGVYHLAGKDIVSPYQMAVATAEVLGLDVSLIENVTADTFPEPVRRAKRSGLQIEKARRDLGYEPVSFAEGVRLTFS